MFLINPIKSPWEVLNHFPETLIQVGTYDPLWDSSFVLYWKLLEADANVKLIEYEFFPHAFLNFHLWIPGLFYEDTREIIDRMS